MDGSSAFRSLRRFWWVVLAAVVAAAGAGYVLAAREPLRYESVASYVVSPRAGDSADVTESVRTLDPARARALVSTHVEILTSAAVQETAAAAAGLGAFPDAYRVEAIVAPEAYVAELRVTGPEAAQAAALSGAIGAEASRRFVELYPIYDIVLLDPASVPTSPVNRGPVETAVIGAVLGLLAGGAIALLAGAPRARRRRVMQQRLVAYGQGDQTVTPFPAERRASRAG